MKSCPCWLNFLADLRRFLALGLRSRTSLTAENLFLRANSLRSTRNAESGSTDRQSAPPDAPVAQPRVQLAKRINRLTPKTFVGWHRKGFQFFWSRKCQSGRSRIPPELQHLIRIMAGENKRRPSFSSNSSAIRCSPHEGAAYDSKVSAKVAVRTCRQPSP